MMLLLLLLLLLRLLLLLNCCNIWAFVFVYLPAPPRPSSPPGDRWDKKTSQRATTKKIQKIKKKRANLVATSGNILQNFNQLRWAAWPFDFFRTSLHSSFILCRRQCLRPVSTICFCVFCVRFRQLKLINAIVALPISNFVCLCVPRSASLPPAAKHLCNTVQQGTHSVRNSLRSVWGKSEWFKCN